MAMRFLGSGVRKQAFIAAQRIQKGQGKDELSGLKQPKSCQRLFLAVGAYGIQQEHI